MACGHTLRSRLKDCKKGDQCRGELWKPAFINDSCAACHRPMNYRQIRALYEAKHSVLMAEYREAKSTGNEEKMRRLQRAMIRNTQLSRLGNFAVSLTRDAPCGDVQWPTTDKENGSSGG
ncbi:uncharacterized protein CTRU02_212189 [Colletotrichum truncatum]|uniref:Uncharacterized protein n=1 Tax=Colletotrichum truncatum TaxID=5467 RepID=A0ACC3YMV1_COLTU|nr:uncharacterized protein CTRU02_06740 [Colletotrichum truncatum]KAF6792123.1 hypothetical protein CTRU02_06740 [Colletotrichum truncatum]